MFDLFTEYCSQSIEAGTIEVQDQKMTFDLVLQNEWQEGLNKILTTFSIFYPLLPLKSLILLL
ncbi:MAG: hypothetical protein OXM55_01650 [Bdellovibrionales bacterium]|nr:hypothetical protein [Bdellovibrionales bacterium]